MWKKKKTFTLIELLAVIIILAVILVISIPKILNVIDESKKDLFKTSEQLIEDSAEKKYITNKLQNNDEKVTCDNIAQLSKEDYSKCTIRFNSEGKATINLIGNRIKPLYNYENKYDIVIITDVGYYGLGITSVEIPDTATSIGYRAFAKNQLTNVTIIFPTTPLTIDCYAFDNNLEWIIYPSNVTVESCK